MNGDKENALADRPHRAVLIGLDGANFEGIKPLLADGQLPNIARLLRQGTLCENAYAPYPTLTGSNWATIATGAWPGTHGVTDMSYHVTGEPLDYWHSGFTSNAVEAESLWEALARNGKKSIVLKYPGSWPPRHPDIVMVDGGGGRPFWGGSFLELSHGQLFSTEYRSEANVVQTTRANGWTSLPQSAKPPLECLIEYRPQSGRIPEFLQFDGQSLRVGECVRMWGLVTASGVGGYDTVALCRDKDPGSALAILERGKWQSIDYTFVVGGNPRRGGARILLDDLDPETGALSLYFSQVYPTDGFTQPAAIGAELVRRFGPYINHPGFSEFAMGWFRHGPEPFLQLMEYQNEWLARAGRRLIETQQWDLFAMQCHCIDFANHTFLPRRGWTLEQREQNLRLLARCYRSVDRVVGEILEAASDDCLVCVVSDHGATESPGPEVFINPILAEAGLLAYEQAPADAVHRRVDLSRTAALQQRSAFVYVNLQGRDQSGIVPPERYEATKDRIIAALRDYREPATGRNPFSMILRKEDAHILGLYDNLGRDIGDVVYALLPDFDHEHGRQLPGATLGGQTMKPLLIFSGPGIKSHSVMKRHAWLVDVAPTIAHAMDWPVPTETEGAVLHQLFDGHTTEFPRQDSIETQDRRMRALRSRAPDREPGGKLPGDERPQDAAAYEQYRRITHDNT